MANEMQNVVFQDEAKARKWLESHLWADGRPCGYCGTVDNSTPFPAPREGYYQCNEASCRKQFTVQVGTLFERSHIPLNKWLLVAFLMSCSKKGISTHQLHRMIGVSYKSTWFMTHRLREAMRDGKFTGPLGGEGKIVEADETWIGGKEKNKHKSKRNKKNIGGAGKEQEEAMTKLLLASIDNKDGEVVISLRSTDGRPFAVSMNTMDAMSLVNALGQQMAEVLKQPDPPLIGMPLHHVQYVENEEAVYFRAFVTDVVYHEYKTPKNTTLSEALKALADTYEAASMRLAIRQAPDRTKN